MEAKKPIFFIAEETELQRALEIYTYSHGISGRKLSLVCMSFQINHIILESIII